MSAKHPAAGRPSPSISTRAAPAYLPFVPQLTRVCPENRTNDLIACSISEQVFDVKYLPQHKKLERRKIGQAFPPNAVAARRL